MMQINAEITKSLSGNILDDAWVAWEVHGLWRVLYSDGTKGRGQWGRVVVDIDSDVGLVLWLDPRESKHCRMISQRRAVNSEHKD